MITTAPTAPSTADGGDRKDKGPFERPVKDLPSTEASTDPSLPPLPRATTARRAHRARVSAHIED
jgi:hypothetical protein